MNFDELSTVVTRRFLHKQPASPETVADEPWMFDALCTQVDPDIFFPEQGSQTHAAKRICAACPVTTDCLEFGMNDHYGVYGGLSAKERQKLRNGRVA